MNLCNKGQDSRGQTSDPGGLQTLQMCAGGVRFPGKTCLTLLEGVMGGNLKRVKCD